LRIETQNTNLHIVLLFLDGVGIGKKDADTNPFFRARMPTLAALCGGELPFKPFKKKSTDQAEVIAISATLGVSGLPQSGTGKQQFSPVSMAQRNLAGILVRTRHQFFVRVSKRKIFFLN
jgi:hypothetical protein